MYNFEYIDIILLAMIAAFVFLRLRGILGRRSGHEGKSLDRLKNGILAKQSEKLINLRPINDKNELTKEAKEHFLKGAKQAYETIITSFAKGDKSTLKTLLGDKIYNEFSSSIDERNEKKIISETTFIGVKSVDIKELARKDNTYTITVDFVSEIITSIKDKDNKIIEGNPDIIKTVNDCWKFSKNMWSHNPTWYLVETLK